MNYPITRTKVILPRRIKDLLQRSRLLRMLDDLLEYRLILIAAPAGYGKTSLLVDLAHEVEYPVAWYSLDPLDRDLFRFLNHLTAAIGEVFPLFGAATRSLIDNPDSGGLDSEQILRTIVNDLYDHVEEHFALVLDDFHLVEDSPQVSHFVSRLAQEVDENCHLVITSRTLLSLPDLPLMIGRSQVKGLSFEELAFAPEEIQDLYQLKYGQDLSSQAAEEIAQETDGWITGLLLTAETTRKGPTEHTRAARAAGIDIYDYLAAQVLELQAPDLQDFLLQTSLLEEFNEDLCQRVLGEPGGEKSWGDLIQELLQANLFIQTVENGGTWLRYQHLFQEFLQHHFLQGQPERAEHLQRKLTAVYQDLGWWEKAYSTSQLLGDQDITVRLIEDSSIDLIHQGRISLLSVWLGDLSANILDVNPALLVQKGNIANLSGDPGVGFQILSRALASPGVESNAQLKALILLRRATSQRFLGKIQASLQDAEQALEIARESTAPARLLAESEREIALNKLRLGQNAEARLNLERSLAIYSEQKDPRNAAFAMMDLGLLDMNQGHYEPARGFFRDAFQIWEELGNLSQLIGLCNNLGVLDHLTGNFQEAYGWFSQALEYARQTSSLRNEAYTLASLGDLASDLGALAAAKDYYDQAAGLAGEIGDTFLRNYLALSRVDLAARGGRPEEVQARLAGLRIPAEDHPSSTISGRYHLFQGHAALRAGNLAAARQALGAAREIFERSSSPAEAAAASLFRAKAGQLMSDQAACRSDLERAWKIIEDLGTVQPLVPHLAEELDFFSACAQDDPIAGFLSRLAQEVGDFQARLPELRVKLGLETVPGQDTPAAVLEISALGRVRVKLEGKPLTAPEWTKQKTVRELLFFLLSQPDGASREEICLVFWPESHPDQLTKQFKNALYRLRRAIGKDWILFHQPTRLYHFNKTLDYRYDVDQFTAALAAAKTSQDAEENFQAMRKAAALYQHPFAPSLDGLWSEPVRYRLFLAFEQVSLKLAEETLRRRNPAEALVVIEKLLQADPSQEAACRLAMRAYQALGDRTSIERVYQRCREALARSLDAEPDRETDALYRALMA